MILKTTLVLLLLWTTLTMGQQEKRECRGPLSSSPFVSIDALLEYYSRCTFPTDKLNSSCILSSCPLLRGACPLTNETALNNAVSILTSCLGQKGLICGVNMSRLPMVEFEWTTAELVPVSMANGTASINTGTGYLNNLSKATFTVNKTSDENGLTTLVIEAIDINGEGYCSCNFSIPSASLLRPFGPFTSSLSSLSFLHTPNVHGVYHLNLSSTVSIDIRALPPTLRTFDDHFNISPDFSNFVTLNGLPLSQTIQLVFNENMATFFKQSVIPSVATNFLATYAALALQGAQQKCP